jgi:recombination protein RecA
VAKKKTAEQESARADAFEHFLNQQAKDSVRAIRLDDNSIEDNVVAIPTGAISLDVALGCGGFPRGRVIELFGPYMSGKTSLALSVAAQCQKQGGTVGFIDAEHALNRAHALGMGVDPHTLVIYQPSSGEDGIDMTEKMVNSRGFDMVIVDSVAAMTPKAEIEAEVEQQHMGLHARLMSKFMRRIATPCSETDTMLILINQVRANLGAYGAPDVSTGGQAIKFQSSVRIEVRSANSKRIPGPGKDNFIGQTCIATVKKNKVGPPHRVAEYDLIFGKGIQAGGSLLDVCEQQGIVTRPAGGSTYTDVTTGEKLGVGKEKVKARLESDPELMARLTAAVYASLSGEWVAPVGDGDALSEQDE